MEILVNLLEWKLWPLSLKSWRGAGMIIYAIYLGPITIYPHGRY
jgi:hypothetical protein